MKNCLVVCYSRTGWTAKVAQEIANLCGADVEVIREAKDRAGFRGYLRSVIDSICHRTPDILPSNKDPANYALVVLGTPVWAGNMAAPMRSYLQRNRLHFNRIAVFCTMGGSGGERALNEMAMLCGKEPLARAVITDAEIQCNSYYTKLAPLRRQTVQR